MQGRRIGDYELLDRLGRGGMGVVYRARDSSGREVALKLIHEGLLSPQRRARFAREAQALAKLRDPSILTVHAAGEDEGVPYLVCDLIEGQSLEALFEGQPAPAERVLALAVALARALEHAHAAGVWHRDVKPENVVIHPADGRPVLLDFGLSKLEGEDGLTQSGAGAGTFGYAAPEQLQDASRVDARADVFGLGATLYALLCGQAPGADLPATAALIAALEGRLPPPRALRPDLDPAWDVVLGRALAPLGQRYPDMRALREDLEALAAGRTPRHARNRRSILALAAGALALAAGLALALAPRARAQAHPETPTPAPGASGVERAVSPTTADPHPAPAPDWAAGLAGLPDPLPEAIGYGGASGVFVHRPSGIELVWVPPGTTWIGSAEPVAWEVAGFFVGRTEVTRAQLEPVGLRPGARTMFTMAGEGPGHPVSRVSYVEAEAFCRHHGLALPTYAQWCRAAFAEAREGYPWGQAVPSAGRPIANLRGDADGSPFSSPAGAFPEDRSPWGALDMGGNLREWVRGAPPGEPWDSGQAWGLGSSFKLKLSDAARGDPGIAYADDMVVESVGFRVVYEP